MTTEVSKKGGCLSDTRGLATVEYILIACLVALLSFGAFKALSGTVHAKVDEATATIAQLPSESEDAGSASASAMGSGAAMGLGAGGAAGGGCAAHVASGGGAGAPCDPASFGSCVGGGETTVVISCNPATGLTTAR